MKRHALDLRIVRGLSIKRVIQTHEGKGPVIGQAEGENGGAKSAERSQLCNRFSPVAHRS